MTKEGDKAKLRAFVNDTSMQDAVKRHVLSVVLRERTGADVHLLAAQTIAFQVIEDAWRMLERFREVERADEQHGNPGM